jgi:hypothetical protein
MAAKKDKKVTKEEKNNFSIEIEKLASQLNISYMETITYYCDKTGLEVEMAGSLVNDVLKAKIRHEAQNLRYLPRTSKLPI